MEAKAGGTGSKIKRDRWMGQTPGMIGTRERYIYNMNRHKPKAQRITRNADHANESASTA